jgi:predicted nucleic acid-binding protein
MLVVSDATPLNILIILGQEHILPALFGVVVVPPAVAEELSRDATAPGVRSWIAAPPAWLRTQTPSIQQSPDLPRHRGERDAMRPALELNADAILLDDHAARVRASGLGLRIIGTVGILEEAANRGHIPDLAKVHDQLRTTWFYVSEPILTASLARHHAWRDANPPS